MASGTWVSAHLTGGETSSPLSVEGESIDRIATTAIFFCFSIKSNFDSQLKCEQVTESFALRVLAEIRRNRPCGVQYIDLKKAFV